MNTSNSNGAKSATDNMKTPAGQKEAFDRGGNPNKMAGLKDQRNTGKNQKGTDFMRKCGNQNS